MCRQDKVGRVTIRLCTIHQIGWSALKEYWICEGRVAGFRYDTISVALSDERFPNRKKSPSSNFISSANDVTAYNVSRVTNQLTVDKLHSHHGYLDDLMYRQMSEVAYFHNLIIWKCHIKIRGIRVFSLVRMESIGLKWQASKSMDEDADALIPLKNASTYFFVSATPFSATLQLTNRWFIRLVLK